MSVLEIIIRQLKHAGFSDITLAIGYLGSLLQAYFGDGAKLGVRIKYSAEEIPLGTAGPLALIRDLGTRFLVMNGDILTTLDYCDLAKCHRESGALATIAMYHKTVETNLGVLKVDEAGHVLDYIEKPTLDYQASMGIYVLEARVLNYIQEGCPTDFPALVKKLIGGGEHIAAYAFSGYWRDIGRREDYESAASEFPTMRGSLIGNGAEG
jgi:NDP-sugar pyrophosphorylase family protein